MATPFSRSLRALEADDQRLALAGLAVAAALLIAWCSWFFLATIPHYSHASEVLVQEGSTLRVQFPPGDVALFRRGQRRTLLVTVAASDEAELAQALQGTPVRLEAIVDAVEPGRGWVQFYLPPNSRRRLPTVRDEFGVVSLPQRLELAALSRRQTPAQWLLAATGLGAAGRP